MAPIEGRVVSLSHLFPSLSHWAGGGVPVPPTSLPVSATDQERGGESLPPLPESPPLVRRGRGCQSLPPHSQSPPLVWRRRVVSPSHLIPTPGGLGRGLTPAP